MGTTMEKAVLMQGGKLVTNLLRPFAAQQWPYHVMEQLVFGQHNRRFRPNRTAKDWLTSDPQRSGSLFEGSLHPISFFFSSLQGSLYIDTSRQ